MRARRDSILFKSVFGLLAVGLALFLIIPVLALCTTLSFDEWQSGLASPLIWPAFKLSLWTTLVSTVLVALLGTPLAWLLHNRGGKWARLLETVVQLPIVMPPAVVGVALLISFGRNGMFGQLLATLGITVSFSTLAVMLAQVFVASPIYLQAALQSFRRLDPEHFLIAETSGASSASVFFRVALPLALPSLAAGLTLAWARSLGEFGATLMFAGNLVGETQTLPLAVYATLESDVRAAQAASILMVGVALFVLFVTHALMQPKQGKS